MRVGLGWDESAEDDNQFIGGDFTGTLIFYTNTYTNEID